MTVDSKRGALADTRRRRVHEVLTAYLDHQHAEHAKGRLCPRTLVDYTRVNEKLRAVLPNVEVTSLTREQVQKAITALATTYATDAPRTEVVVNGKRKLGAPRKSSPQEGNRALNQLRRILKFAQGNNWVVKNVAEHVTPFKATAMTGDEDVQPDVRAVWEPSEVMTFLSEVQNHRLYPLFYLKLSYGFRIGELMALRWSDVDCSRAEIKIMRSYDPMNGLGPPKWGSARTLSITDTTMTVLRLHRIRQDEERMAQDEAYVDNGLVFPTLLGSYTNHENVRRAFNGLIRKAGVPRIKVHGMRHTAASAMIRAGLDVVHVAGILGHKDPSMTLKIYSHLFAEHRRAHAYDATSLYALPSPPEPQAAVLN
ncbi:tyrosine-type recombinase/integrase [Deinococcus aquaedulcis]|uniref:tyrosine-type recombinase/integrase n=1 Tax=Deinococcus aquaedulcis TaxID=2840455 RepID=UPI001C84074B|nr:tyrosine-type recombinase/integrase [Deinococcus aquaedulcis]